MKLYHGSKEKFEKFSFDKIGLNGTSEGKGFYLTTDEQIASGYGTEGYLYEFDLEVNENNSINDQEIRFSREDYKKLILALDEEVEYLSNYGEVGFEGLNVVLERAVESEFNYSDSDVEIISGMANGAGSIEVVNRLVHKMFKVSYIIEKNPVWGAGQSIVVALIPEILKIGKVRALKK